MDTKQFIVVDSEGVRYPVPESIAVAADALRWFAANWRGGYPDALAYLNNGWWTCSDGDNVNSACYSAQRQWGLAFFLLRGDRLVAFAPGTVLDLRDPEGREPRGIFEAPIQRGFARGAAGVREGQVCHA
jgi:hypothetical protein